MTFINTIILSCSTPRNEGFGARTYEDPFWSDENNISYKTWDFNYSEDSSLDESVFGNLYFEYFDNGSPYWRIPFNSRVNDLCRL